MSNPMILQLKITREKLKKEYLEHQIKMSRLLTEMTSKVNPYFDEIEDIDAVAIEQIGDELLICKTKIVELKEKLSKISKELDE